MSSPRTDVMAWVASVLAKEMQTQAYGRVSVILKAGRIIAVQVERSEQPPAEIHETMGIDRIQA